jgi:choline dehydrogenase-like flavoprotein
MIHGFSDPIPTGPSGAVDADAVIAGTGPGGASVARVLSAAGWKVLLLEEGPPRSRFRPSFANVQRFHMQEGGLLLVRRPVPIVVAAGRGVGGSSLINGAICWRTPEPVLRDWAARLADDRFLPENLAPTFDEIERRIDVVPVTESIAGENNLLVARGVAALGLGGGLLRRNAPGCVGCGICNLGCPSGGKNSVDKNLVVDALQNGARIQADCKVQEVLIERGRAVGLRGRLSNPETQEPGPIFTVRAKVVVLSAGAVGTPRLLWHCGLAERLGPVGDQLFLHPGSAVIGRCEHEVHWWKGVTQGAYIHDEANPHVLPHTFNAPPEAWISVCSAVGFDAKQALLEMNRLCGLGVMVSDHGHGSVRATKSGRASLSYELDPADVQRMKDGLVLSARVLLAGGAKEVFVTAHGAKRHGTPESLAAELAATPLFSFWLYSAHPMSTCPMGTDPETSVVTPRGRAHRMAGLYLADAGIFPSSLGVNPQVSTMAMATLVGRAIAEDEA